MIERVLCVDDDPFMLELYSMSLAQLADLEVVVVQSAEEAIASGFLDDVGAVVLDLGLPGMSGADLLAWIRERSDVPVLVITGEETREHARLKELGATAVLSKPVPLGELRRWIELSVR